MYQSKGLSAKKLTTAVTIDNGFSPSIKWYRDSNLRLIFKGSCLKNTIFTPPNRKICFIVYELDTWSSELNSYFALKDCLFRGVKLAKNDDPDIYESGSGIGFDSCSQCPLPDGSVGKNVIIFG